MDTATNGSLIDVAAAPSLGHRAVATLHTGFLACLGVATAGSQELEGLSLYLVLFILIL